MSSKVSHDDDHLDLGKVEKEAKSLITYDDRYWVENSAKFRAVEQRVATYDEFREIVKASHLKPLEKDDKISSMGTFTQVWNQAANGRTPQSWSKVDTQVPGAGTRQDSFKLPETGQEFLQRWKRECKTLEQKKTFLLTVGAPTCREIFKTEISGGLLGEFLQCLDGGLCDAEAAGVVDLLEALAASKRFSLSLAFLSKKEKDYLKSLFNKLCEGLSSEEVTQVKERVETLKSVYSV